MTGRYANNVEYDMNSKIYVKLRHYEGGGNGSGDSEDTENSEDSEDGRDSENSENRGSVRIEVAMTM